MPQILNVNVPQQNIEIITATGTSFGANDQGEVGIALQRVWALRGQGPEYLILILAILAILAVEIRKALADEVVKGADGRVVMLSL